LYNGIYEGSFIFVIPAIAEVYKNEGNDAHRKKEFRNAIYFYTEGIKVNCKDEELKAKLYSNRATAHFYLGENLITVCYSNIHKCSTCFTLLIYLPALILSQGITSTH